MPYQPFYPSRGRGQCSSSASAQFRNIIRSPVAPIGKLHLFDLDQVVIWEILDRLDPRALLNLRLVCQQTKEWVESPIYLNKLPIEIKTFDDVENILKSNVPWTKCSLYLTEGPKNMVSFHALKFLRKVNLTVTNLEVNFEAGSCLTDVLMNVGPQLESLHYTGAGIDSYRMPDHHWPLTRYEESRLPKENFAKLKHLIIQIRLLNHKTLRHLQSIVEFVIKNSPNLITLKLPSAFPSEEAVGAATRIEYRSPIDCKNLLKFLTPKKLRDSDERPPTKILDFCSGVETIDTADEPLLMYPLKGFVLIQMSRLCQPTSSGLYNVPLTALPSRSQFKFLKKSDKLALMNCIKSVLSVNNNIFHIGDVYLPPTANLYIVIRADEERREDFAEFDLPHDTNIHSITLLNASSDDVKGKTSIGKMCLGTLRVTLAEIKVVFANYVRETIQIHRRLDLLFPFLKKLTLISNHSKFVPILTDLNFAHLEDLSLKNTCPNFYRMVTAENFPHCVFARLVHLSLIDVPTRFFRNETFTQVFCQMKPKTFIFRPFIEDFSCLSFKPAIQSLISIDGGFKDTVETFEITSPFDAIAEDMNGLVSQFTKAKRTKIHYVELELDSD